MTSEHGVHRVKSPIGVLPQAAAELDTSITLQSNEILIEVSYLNLDSASYLDFVKHHDGNEESIKQEILRIVDSRGKLVNPRTGSGGMLVGRITALSSAAEVAGYTVGQRIASLISLTATPLTIEDRLEAWDTLSEIVPVTAHAIMPTHLAVHPVPDAFDERVALSVLDVCGAPAFAERLIQRSESPASELSMLILGGGKSAVLASAAARRYGVSTISVVPSKQEANSLRKNGLFDTVVVADARNPVEVRDAIECFDELPQLTLVCVNVPGCEHAAFLATRPGGSIVFFSMATSFTKVALGAESLSIDFDLYFGTGYLPGHADLAIDLALTDDRVLQFFHPKYTRVYENKQEK